VVTWLDRQGPVQVEPSLPTPAPTLIRIDAKENIYLDNQLVDVGDISHTVSNLMRRNPKTRVIVRSHPGVSYSLVMEVVDGLRSAGCSNILLETDNTRP
jgi:biopolymer transport protein ExbD